MVDPEYHARAQDRAAAAAAAAVVPITLRRPLNVWDEYERTTDEWNRSPQVQERYTNRIRMINNTAGYHTGNNTLHIRSIQMYGAVDWNALFGTEQLDPHLREYAQAAIEYAQDETGTVPFAGQMEVSLIMQENYRRGIHLAIFMVHLSPHRRFYDGHIIQKEFSEGSRTHQIINRLFDTNTRAVVLQATQYQFLEYLADYDEALDLINDCFIDPDFTPMRFSYVAAPNHDLGGYYVTNPNALNDHRLHYCAEEDQGRLHQPQQHQHQHQQEPHAAAAEVEPVIAIPPPPPVYDFEEIYQRNIVAMYYDNNNIIPIHGGDEEQYDEEAYYPIQG